MEYTAIKSELLRHLNGGMAFKPLTELLKEISFDQLGIRPDGLPYSFFELFYHLKFAQRDILDFMKADSYEIPAWPTEYWPNHNSPTDREQWETLKRQYLTDCKELENYLNQTQEELLQPVKNASQKEQSLLRELLLIVTHSAYHTGQLMVVLRLLK